MAVGFLGTSFCARLLGPWAKDGISGAGKGMFFEPFKKS